MDKEKKKYILDQVLKTEEMIRDLSILEKIGFITELTGTFLSTIKFLTGADISEEFIKDVRDVMNLCSKIPYPPSDFDEKINT